MKVEAVQHMVLILSVLTKSKRSSEGVLSLMSPLAATALKTGSRLRAVTFITSGLLLLPFLLLELPLILLLLLFLPLVAEVDIFLLCWPWRVVEGKLRKRFGCRLLFQFPPRGEKPDGGGEGDDEECREGEGGGDSESDGEGAGDHHRCLILWMRSSSSAACCVCGGGMGEPRPAKAGEEASSLQRRSNIGCRLR